MILSPFLCTQIDPGLSVHNFRILGCFALFGAKLVSAFNVSWLENCMCHSKWGLDESVFFPALDGTANYFCKFVFLDHL